MFQIPLGTYEQCEENAPAGTLANERFGRARVRAALDRRECAARDLNQNQTCSLTSFAARD